MGQEPVALVRHGAHAGSADTNRATLGPPAGNGQMVTTLAAPLGATDTSLTVGSTSSFGAGSAVLPWTQTGESRNTRSSYPLPTFGR